MSVNAGFSCHSCSLSERLQTEFVLLADCPAVSQGSRARYSPVPPLAACCCRVPHAAATDRVLPYGKHAADRPRELRTHALKPSGAGTQPRSCRGSCHSEWGGTAAAGRAPLHRPECGAPPPWCPQPVTIVVAGGAAGRPAAALGRGGFCSTILQPRMSLNPGSEGHLDGRVQAAHGGADGVAVDVAPQRLWRRDR